MLQIILIGAALSHVRPEPPTDDGLPTDPIRTHREHWRISIGVESVLALTSPPKTHKHTERHLGRKLDASTGRCLQ